MDQTPGIAKNIEVPDRSFGVREFAHRGPTTDLKLGDLASSKLSLYFLKKSLSSNVNKMYGSLVMH